jgi:SnoaL-like domain
MSIEEKFRIQELNYYYALYVDKFQIDQWVNVFTPDGYFDESEFGYGLHVGHDAIRAYGVKLVEDNTFVVHLMANHIITDLTDTSAKGTVFALVEGLTKTNIHARFQVIYEDEYAKIKGDWKIKKRVLRKTFPVEMVP